MTDLSLKIKQRDRWTCRLCGAKFIDLQTARYGNDNDDINSWITLCSGCLKKLFEMPPEDAKAICAKAQRQVKVVLIGDCHGDFVGLDEALTAEAPFDFFLSVGDVGTLHDVTPDNIQLIDKWGDKGHFVFGNHDNCWFFKQLELHQEICGLNVASLNGMLKSRTFLKETPNNISFREVMYLSHLKNIDILVTHQPPTGLFSDAGEPVLGELLNYLVPKIYISGHIHQYKLKFHLQTFVISLPMIHKGHVVAYFQGNDLRNIEIVLKKGKKVIRV